MGSPYAITTRVDSSFDETIDTVTERLADEGFGLLSDIDVQAKMAEKLDREMKGYRILGACAPPLAWDVLHAKPDVGVFLPCNVVVYEDDQGVVVSAMDPGAVLEMVDDKTVHTVANEVRERLVRVLDGMT